MADLSIPNTFVSGSFIVAADMNANFDAIETKINTTGVHVYEAASIETEALENNAVTHAKMDSKTVGQQVTSGFARITADTSAAGNILSITVDGASSAAPMKIEAYLPVVRNAGSALTTAQALRVALRDGTTDLQIAQFSGVATDQQLGPVKIEIVVPAFTGSKTFHVTTSTAAGTPVVLAGATYPATLRATWAPGHSTS